MYEYPGRRTAIGWAGLAMMVVGCGDTPTEQSVALAVAPDSIELTDAGATTSIYLSTTPSGGRLDWQLAGKPDWLTLSPASGTINGDVMEAEVTVPGLAVADAGIYPGTISLISEGGAAEVGVRVVLEANPEAQLSISELVIGDSTDEASFQLRNVGRGVLFWSVDAASASLQVAPQSGSVEFGDSVEITVTADKEPLAVGEHTASLTLGTSGDQAGVTLPVRIQVPPAPRAALQPSRLLFQAGTDTVWLTLTNPGKGPLSWTGAPSDQWITASPTAGDLDADASVELAMTVDRAASGEEASGTFTVSSNSVDGAVSADVVVTASTGMPDGFTVLDHRPVDAVYSAALDLIVTVSAEPAQLNIIDLPFNAIDTVELDLAPTSVAVQPDGRYAAVGHDGAISYVDLGTRSVEQVYTVAVDVFDVVLPGNGWVYAMPRVDQWVSIHSVDLGTGSESGNSGTARAGTVMKLHPSGDFMYGANRGLSPSDFEKYDIRDGAATVMYDSPYHGDYEFGGDIWISEDGLRLFARSGNVFRSSSVQAEDMTYSGSLSGVDWVRGVSEGETLDRVLALPATDWGSTPTPELRVYGTAYLALLGTLTLPEFPHPTDSVTSLGQYVFAAGDGDHAYILVQADPAAGVQHDWAILKLPASELPQ